MRENLDLLNLSNGRARVKLPDDEAVGVLTRVGLWNHIRAHGGLDADIATMHMTSTQMQYLQLARGILRSKHAGAKVILIDLDVETEPVMQRVVMETFSSCTVLMLSKEGNLFSGIDLFLEMKDGGIVHARKFVREASRLLGWRG